MTGIERERRLYEREDKCHVGCTAKAA